MLMVFVLTLTCSSSLSRRCVFPKLDTALPACKAQHNRYIATSIVVILEPE